MNAHTIVSGSSYHQLMAGTMLCISTYVCVTARALISQNVKLHSSDPCWEFQHGRKTQVDQYSALLGKRVACCNSVGRDMENGLSLHRMGNQSCKRKWAQFVHRGFFRYVSFSFFFQKKNEKKNKPAEHQEGEERKGGITGEDGKY
mmetsp:Transcript_20048/g.38689  ORF Transcript_20048/g.38689 Transcript_20048/m.38689 type:complete len:146 (+) Transcript_20048:153-590(+)